MFLLYIIARGIYN